MQDNNTESGRSFVEMLGTLAIMGILSIGALVAYNYAMNGLRANTILYEVNKRAHTCATQIHLMGRDVCRLSEYEENIDGKYPAQVIRMDNGYFGIRVGEISEWICRQIQSKGLKIASEIIPESCDEGEVTFIINKDLDGTTDGLPVKCESGEVCGDCEECGASGFCESICTGGAKCAADFERPNAAKSCCPASKLVGGVCCANPDGNGNCCDSSGKNCCPPNKPIRGGVSMGGESDVCYSCNENISMMVNWKTYKCNRCDNRVYRDAGYNLIGWCIPKECPPDKPLMSFNGICYACGSSVQMKSWVLGTTGDLSSCAACEENGLLDNLLCRPCPNDMTNVNGICTCPPGEMVGHDSKYTGDNWSSIKCYSCGTDNLKSIIFWRENSNACTACPDRVKVLVNEQSSGYTYSFCALETCPTGYMHNRYGDCVSCAANNSVRIKSSSLSISCSECGGFYTDGDYCKKCPDHGTGAWNNLSDSQRLECGG